MLCLHDIIKQTSLIKGVQCSVVVVGLIESDVVLGVDDEVGGVDVVALEDHVEDLRLVDGALLHEVDDLVLNHHRVVHIVVQLHLHFILQLTRLVQELLVLHWFGEILVILSKEVKLADVCPRVESVTEGVLRPYAYVLAATEEVELVDLLLQVLPVENVGQPREGIAQVEDHARQLPRPPKGVNEEDVVGKRDEGVIHAIRVLQVHCAVLDVIAGVEEELTIAVELEGLRGLIHFVCALEVLSRTLGQLCLSRPHDLVQVLHLTETPLGLLHQGSVVG